MERGDFQPILPHFSKFCLLSILIYFIRHIGLLFLVYIYNFPDVKRDLLRLRW